MRPSHSQRQALADIERHGDPWYRVHGQSQHGGWSGVMRVLIRNHWAKGEGRKWALTDAGRAALAQARAFE